MSLQHLWEIKIDGPKIVGIGAMKLAQQCQQNRQVERSPSWAMAQLGLLPPFN